ncbi:MAG: hypothetical protein IJW27_05505, partial [Clostridia bacterium]|nr:hypothetical protein [Clostridia bacterium]
NPLAHHRILYTPYSGAYSPDTLASYEEMTEFQKRKPTRLKGFDYGGNEEYFVTICTHNGQNTLSEIVVGEGLAPPEVKLSALGKIAEAQILNLPTRFWVLRV